jgi:hypothetical protein
LSGARCFRFVGPPHQRRLPPAVFADVLVAAAAVGVAVLAVAAATGAAEAGACGRAVAAATAEDRCRLAPTAGLPAPAGTAPAGLTADDGPSAGGIAAPSLTAAGGTAVVSIAAGGLIAVGSAVPGCTATSALTADGGAAAGCVVVGGAISGFSAVGGTATPEAAGDPPTDVAWSWVAGTCILLASAGLELIDCGGYGDASVVAFRTWPTGSVGPIPRGVEGLGLGTLDWSLAPLVQGFQDGFE